MSAFDRIIGYEQTKRELMQISDILRHYEYYEQFGVACPKGLLLHGKPGVGKTLMAECLMKDSERPMFVCRKDKSKNIFGANIFFADQTVHTEPASKYVPSARVPYKQSNHKPNPHIVVEMQPMWGFFVKVYTEKRFLMPIVKVVNAK